MMDCFVGVEGDDVLFIGEKRVAFAGEARPWELVLAYASEARTWALVLAFIGEARLWASAEAVTVEVETLVLEGKIWMLLAIIVYNVLEVCKQQTRANNLNISLVDIANPRENKQRLIVIGL